MAELVDRYDPYTERDVEPFERLCVSIINQQLSTASAAAVRERAFGEADLTPEGLADRSDEAVVDRLTEIRGVGPWTAEMYLIFVLERSDVLPLGDLAIRRGIEDLYGDGDGMSRAEMRKVAESWRPYRSHGTRYVWAAYESG